MHEARCGGQGLRRDRLRTIGPLARGSFFGRALLTAFALTCATTAPASAADAAARPAPRAPGLAPLPRVTSPRLYVIDCGDRKSTRLNSSHSQISYAVFCLKKKKLHDTTNRCLIDRRSPQSSPPRAALPTAALT